MKLWTKLSPLTLIFGLLIVHVQTAKAECQFNEVLQKIGSLEPIDYQAILEFNTEAKKCTDDFGRVTPSLQESLYQIEKTYYSRFTDEAKDAYQDFLAKIGAKMLNPIRMPQDQTPFWLKDREKYPSLDALSPLPKKADIVIIGAGLTGSSAAYYLSKEPGNKNKTILVLEANYPASASSGRNGGNFQLLPESYVGNYEGLVQERYKWLKSKKPDADEAVLMRTAKHQARILLQFTYNNFLRFTDLVRKEEIQCDLSPHGWLRIPDTLAEQTALLADEEWMKTTGLELTPETEIWSPQKITENTGIRSQFLGRYISGSGNYHPFKFVMGVLKKASENGVKIYSGVKVTQISPIQTGSVLLETSQGSIDAEKVIVATNAFTPQLFPKLSEIQCYPSQVMNLEHVKNQLKGITVTEKCGDIYYNFPSSQHYIDSNHEDRGMIHFGLDFDHPVQDPNHLPRSAELFAEMKKYTDDQFPDTQNQPPSRLWTGPMAFTPDRVPVIGFLPSKEAPHQNIIIAAAFQGYGGSFCTQAGYVAAQMALTGETPPDVPEDFFSPARFYK